MSPKSNLGTSVMARLLNHAREKGDDYQILLAGYCFERFLYRLGESAARNRFVLKGAMLLRTWSEQPYRATRDLDLLRRGDGSSEAILGDIRLVVSTPVPPDAVEFLGDKVRMESIRAEDEYVGTRAILPAICGTARLKLQIDVGIGDAVWPPPKRSAYPAILDMPQPAVLTYSRETVVAEKLEALVVLGDRNSRIKDFFDLHYLASHFEFDRETLSKAVRKTFERRHTPVHAEEPIGLTAAFWENPTRPAQVRAFARRSGLEVPESIGGEFSERLRRFLLPVLSDLRSNKTRKGTWRDGGPWFLKDAA